MIEKIKGYIRRKVSMLFDLFDRLIYSIPSRRKNNEKVLIDNLIEKGIPYAVDFNFEVLKKETLDYLMTLKSDEDLCSYKFSRGQVKSNLYSSVYALLIFDLYGEIEKFSHKDIREWTAYFDSFQNKEDGLWYDSSLSNEHYNDSDWWGARHLAVHMISAYTALGTKPKYQIKYITKYYNIDFLKKWLDRNDWQSFFEHENDIDNKIMNVGVVLQYQRDFFNDAGADVALEYLFSYLDAKQNEKTGMWGRGSNDSYELSRNVQFSYHLLMLYFYDNRKVSKKELILESAIKTQNSYGGFGVDLNSSACEDIDSIEIILNFSKDGDCNSLLRKALVWILSNRMDDGGFVFRQNQSMWYGHEILTSPENESNIFATWFRTLAIAKISTFMNSSNNFRVHKSPGY